MNGSEHLRRVRLVRGTDSYENDAETVALGTMLPNGSITVQWNRQAFPEGERTGSHTFSMYADVADAEQASGATVEFIDAEGPDA